MENRPKLRDGYKVTTHELYPLNEISNDIVIKICSHLVYLMAVGQKDISGNDFGDALADAIGGCHFASPVGIADVALDKMAWSVKTVKCTKPLSISNVRLISGRNSPDYSYGIEDPHKDIQKTGEAVLKIWNERINIAYSQFNPVREMVLVRSNDLTEYALYEEEIQQIRISDYHWEINNNGNFIGIDNYSNEVKFTWQPHGSQFTIHSTIPTKVIKFHLKKPETLDKRSFLINLKYNDTWVHILKH